MARISTKVSLNGVKELYLIIVGLGITTALSAPPNNFYFWIFVVFGYFPTILRFLLGTINMLEHVAKRDEHKWTKRLLFISLSFLLTSMAFFLVGNYLSAYFKPEDPTTYSHISIYISVLLVLFFDLLTIFISHKPWQKGWGGWIIWKFIAIIFSYPFGLYDPSRYHDCSKEDKLVKRAHYQWIRSDFWFFTALLFALYFIKIDSIPINPWLSINHLHLLIMTVLMTFSAIIDFFANYDYYFEGKK